MELTIGKHKVLVPTWETITPQQLIEFSRLTISEKNPANLKVKLMLLFCGLFPRRKNFKIIDGTPHQWFRFKNKYILISVNAINTISDAILHQFFKIGDDFKATLNIKLTRNIIPPFRLMFRKYAGPAMALSNITFKEFIFADTFYTQFCETESEKALNSLVAVLFRPQKRLLWLRKRLNNFDGDDRIKFNDFQIDRFANKVNRLPREHKQAILYFFMGSRNFILTQFPAVFSGSGTGGNVDTFKMYLSITDALAHSNPINKEAIRNEMLYDVLDSLENMIVNAEKAEQKLKSHKK